MALLRTSPERDNRDSSSSSAAQNETLGIIREFKQLYQDKLRQIDTEGGGDCLELKLKVQQRWIDDLTAQTEMMANVVKELEDEATERVKMLEDKLQQSAKCACEVMKRYQMCDFQFNLDEPLQRVYYLESDIKNLLEFVRRIREENKWSIDGLQFYEVFYNDLFGKDTPCDKTRCPSMMAATENRQQIQEVPTDGVNETKSSEEVTRDESCSKLSTNEADHISKLLRKREKEYKALEQSMCEMRAALAEEIACKHDTILMLKKDVHALEARCIQADKQAAFKDDIIKGMRKEIKQLKQDAVKRKENELEEEIKKRQNEVEVLKKKCEELENTLHNAQGRASNLQRAVDLYINSINVLEASEERAKIQIEQQRITILNLQETLVSTKQELSDLKQRSQQDCITHRYFAKDLIADLINVYDKKDDLHLGFMKFRDFHDKLKNVYFHLEVEHFSCLQDLACLQSQLEQYQTELSTLEEDRCVTRNEIKKLRHQKRCCEQIIAYFREELSVMSEQLIHLQELLNASNRTCKEENVQLMQAVVTLQNTNERLQSQVCNTGQQVMVENQKNRAKDAKIAELQTVIEQKNAELNLHDKAIQDLRSRLENTIIENNDLQTKIGSLSTKIFQLECSSQNYDVIKDLEAKMCSCSHSKLVDIDKYEAVKKELGEKTDRLKVLQDKFEKQGAILVDLTNDVKRNKEKQQHKIQDLKLTADDLRKRLSMSEENNHLWAEKFTSLQNEMACVIDSLKLKLTDSELSNHQLNNALAEARDQNFKLLEANNISANEIQHYREIVGAFREILEDLCESLCSSKFIPKDFLKKRKGMKDASKDASSYLSCYCEITLYKKVVETLKSLIIKFSKNLKQSDTQNDALMKELEECKATICTCENQFQEKEKEMEDMKDKLVKSQAVEARLIEFIDYLKNEMQNKINSKCKDRKENSLNLVTTQEEIGLLKIEIKNMIQNQLALNNENDKLLAQVSHLQLALSDLEEENIKLKTILEGDSLDLQQICECDVQQHERDELEKEYQLLRLSFSQLEKKYRNSLDKAFKLEGELRDIRTDRDNICAESKEVVNNVKLWLTEQRKINDQVKCKANHYTDQINRLKQENEYLLSTVRSLETSMFPKAPNDRIQAGNAKTGCPAFDNNYQSPWSLGSQGSLDRDCPSSFMTCSVDEWYSPTYRDDEENDVQDEHFIKRLGVMREDIEKKNVKWNTAVFPDCKVTKDAK